MRKVVVQILYAADSMDSAEQLKLKKLNKITYLTITQGSLNFRCIILSSQICEQILRFTHATEYQQARICRTVHRVSETAQIACLVSQSTSHHHSTRNTLPVSAQISSSVYPPTCTGADDTISVSQKCLIYTTK